MKSTVEEMGVDFGSEVFNEKDFDECFSQVDTDNSGYIDRKEMLQFIKLIAEIA